MDTGTGSGAGGGATAVDTAEARSPRLRKDAQRNRELLLDAAREVLSEQGLDASLDEIARRAGVGNATLYRRFESREELYEALFADHEERLKQVAQQALLIEDGWTALTTYLEGHLAQSASNRAVGDALTTECPSGRTLLAIRRRHRQTLERLLARAQEQGSARADVTVEDLRLLMSTTCRSVQAIEAVEPGAWRRHLALLFGGLRARRDDVRLSPAPLTPEQYDEVLQQLQPKRPGS